MQTLCILLCVFRSQVFLLFINGSALSAQLDVSPKVDVYAFGVILWEMLGDRSVCADADRLRSLPQYAILHGGAKRPLTAKDLKVQIVRTCFRIFNVDRCLLPQ